MTKQVKLDITAQNKTDAAFAKVNSGLSRIKSNFTGVAAAAGSLGAILGAGALVSKFSALVSKSFEYADELGKVSDRIGIATEKLIGFQHAATLGGMSIDMMNDLLVKMSARIGRAVDGMGPASKRLKQLGLDAKELAGLQADEQFRKIAEEISKLGTQAEKAAAAQDLFGITGRKIITLLDQGQKGLEEVQKDAEKLGLTMSRFDSSKIEQANDAMYRLRAFVTGVANRVAVQLAPTIVGVSNYLVDMGTNAGSLKTVVSRAFKTATEYAGVFGDAVQGLALIFKGIEIAGRAFELVVVTVMQNAYQKVQFFANAFIGLNNLMMEGLKGIFNGLGTYLQKFEDVLNKAKNIPIIGSQFKNAAYAVHDMRAALSGMGDEFDKMKLAKVEDNILLDEWTKASKDGLKVAWEELKKLADTSNGSWGDKFIDKLNSFAKEADKAAAKFKKLKNTLTVSDTDDPSGDRSRNPFSAIKDSFSKTMEDMKVKSEQFKKGFTDDIFDMVTKSDIGFAQIRDKYLNMIAETILKKNLNSLLWGKEGKDGGTTGGIMKIFGFASGGYPPVGRPSLVGENGPELIVPRAPMRVYSNSQTQGMMGGGASINITQNFNMSLGVKETVAAEISAMMPGMIDKTKVAVADAVQRGGSYAKKVRGY